jgi:hypothetical protein
MAHRRRKIFIADFTALMLVERFAHGEMLLQRRKGNALNRSTSRAPG